MFYFDIYLGKIWASLGSTIKPRENFTVLQQKYTPRSSRRHQSHFGAEIIKQHEKYLGLPSLVGKNKCNTFHQLIERLNNKLSRWKEKLLVNVGKEILIKTVAQVVPTYTMSVFKLPNILCEEMTSMVWKFWWGQTSEKSKVTWLSWDEICRPKEEGGLGFRDLKAINLALLEK